MKLFRLLLKKVARKKGSIASERLVDKLISLAQKSRRKNLDAFTLCELSSKVGYTVQTQEAPDLPQSVPAMAVKLKGRYLILYRYSTSLISVQISVLHELCHILLNHCFLSQQEVGKSFYTDEQEAEAERLALLLLCRLVEATPQNAWWEKILEGFDDFDRLKKAELRTQPDGTQPKEQTSLSSSSIRRFMELAPKKREKARSFRDSHVPLARIKQLFP